MKNITIKKKIDLLLRNQKIIMKCLRYEDIPVGGIFGVTLDRQIELTEKILGEKLQE